ncbi:MAG: glycoside hydrolase family 30 protein [Sphingobacteriaceae bacterium]
MSFNLNHSLTLLLFIFNGGCSKSQTLNNHLPPENPTGQKVAFWLTNPDKTALLQKQAVTLEFEDDVNNLYPTIEIDPTQSYQPIDGFGFTFTGGSATLINALPNADKAALLKELFLTEGEAIGISYLRISIGASDLDEHAFTYNDLPAGQTDNSLSKFSLAPDQTDPIPLLKQILLLNPAIKILGSPWSAPAWMKTNNSSKGGALNTQYYATYASYFVKYIHGMAKQGIPIDAITIQNEPLNPKNNPSMVMTAEEQGNFIKNNLGPAFKAAGIKTKIILYDHNADRPDYPMDILKDPETARYVDGSAFHLYGGSIDALTKVHEAYPNKHIYFTEQWIGGPGNFAGDLSWHVNTLIIGATRNWSRNVLEWNLASDPEYGPHTDGGCTTCLGALTIAPKITRNTAYYIIGHASKFVRPGAERIASNISNNLQNVAFKNVDGKKVLIVLNKGKETQQFNVQFNGKKFTSQLNQGAVATYVWE